MKPEEAISLFKWAEQQVGNAEHIELAISALEKQIPKKPIVVDDELEHIMYIWECPACGRQRIDGGKARGSYCKECGQAIDWRIRNECN